MKTGTHSKQGRPRSSAGLAGPGQGPPRPTPRLIGWILGAAVVLIAGAIGWRLHAWRSALAAHQAHPGGKAFPVR